MTVRSRSNPLALAVLACLHEHPMHPYEMASTMKERHQHESIKLNFGSLYTVVDRLQECGLIAERETVTDGRRPPRTIYEITVAGRQEFESWLEDLLRGPACDYTAFEAGLCLLSGLSVKKALTALRERLQALTDRSREMRDRLEGVVASGVPRLYLIEHEYRLSMQEAERQWVEQTVEQIESATLDGVRDWKRGRLHPTEKEETK